nr:Cys loop ligand gated ion channel subunit [Hymenolepis microstoma]
MVNMDYSLDFLLRQRWYDPRLDVSSRYSYADVPIHLHMDKIWLPDLFFRNSKSSELNTQTTPNTLAWISSNGMITYSQKLSVRLFCPMELWDFPIDTQICKVDIGSYGYPTKDLEFRWWNDEGYDRNGTKRSGDILNAAVQFGENLHMNEFDIVSYNCSYCDKNFKNTGSFTCLNIDFTLSRKFGFYLLYAYLPSLLVVMIAWMSFMIDSEATAARTSLGLLTVLSLMTQSAAVLSQLPRVSYIKAIDTWFFICFTFVVGTLLEFAFVNTAARREAKLQKKIAKLSTEQVGSSETGNGPNAQEVSTRKVCVVTAEKPKLYSIRAKSLDRIFVNIYPLFFLIFNVIYWCIYLMA